jgi:hypothetical protein
MMQKSTTFTTILCVKKCHFHYDMQKKLFYEYENALVNSYLIN